MNQFIAKGMIVLMDNWTFFWKLLEEEKLGSRIRRKAFGELKSQFKKTMLMLMFLSWYMYIHEAIHGKKI